MSLLKQPPSKYSFLVSQLDAAIEQAVDICAKFSIDPPLAALVSARAAKFNCNLCHCEALAFTCANADYALKKKCSKTKAIVKLFKDFVKGEGDENAWAKFVPAALATKMNAMESMQEDDEQDD